MTADIGDIGRQTPNAGAGPPGCKRLPGLPKLRDPHLWRWFRNGQFSTLGKLADLSNMLFDPQAGITKVTDNGGGRRSTGRLRQERLQCSLGQILDLSSSGMRLVGRKAPRTDVTVTIYDRDRILQVTARPVWSKRIGLLKREIGLTFVDVSPAQRKTLTAIASANRWRVNVA
jgi:hypothetical protein